MYKYANTRQRYLRDTDYSRADYNMKYYVYGLLAVVLFAVGQFAVKKVVSARLG